MKSMSNLFYVLIDKYFFIGPKCYHGYNLLGDNIVLMLLSFILMQHMDKEAGLKN